MLLLSLRRYCSGYTGFLQEEPIPLSEPIPAERERLWSGPKPSAATDRVCPDGKGPVPPLEQPTPYRAFHPNRG